MKKFFFQKENEKLQIFMEIFGEFSFAGTGV
jgi:hypothetical protein